MPARRLANIDSLRGIAALLVVWQHGAETFVSIPGIAAHGTALADIADAVDFGRVGVVCFFLISGFVIPFSFTAGPGAVSGFAIRRLFRLYPAYWVSVACAVAVDALVRDQAWPSAAIAANSTMLQAFFGQPHIQGLYWTLEAELVFYALCAAIFAAGRLGSPRTLVVCCLAAVAVFGAMVAADRWLVALTAVPAELRYLPLVIAVMFCGAVLRCALDGAVSGASRFAAPALTLGATFGVPFAVFAAHLLGFDLTGHPVRFAAGHLAGLALFAAGLALLRREARPLLWLGAISYSLYLFHPAVMHLVASAAVRIDWLGHAHLALPMTATAVLSLAAAHLVFRTIEARGIALGRRLADRRRCAVAQPQAGD